MAVALFAALVFSAIGGVRRYVSRRRDNARLQRDVEALKGDVENKRSLLLMAKDDPDLLEGEARRQLGLIGEGEVEFRFVPSPGGGGESMRRSDDNTADQQRNP